MNKLKVMTIIGTRPEIIRLSRILSILDLHCNHTIVHTGQNYDYELSQVFFKDLEIREPDHYLNIASDVISAAHVIGNGIIRVDELLDSAKPEAILILGDTNSCLSVLAAKRRKIPIFHMEAGNRCFDMRVPEEINRRIIDHISDVNLTYTSIARNYLLNEGLQPDLVIKVGSPMYEVISYYRKKIEESNIIDQLQLTSDNYFLISVHREENIESHQNFHKLVNILNSIAKDYLLPVIVSTHPRTQRRIDEGSFIFHPLVNFLKPMGYFDYVKLQIYSRAVLSDSGTINEESSILNFPALNLREAHERPEGMEEGAVMMTGLEIVRINQGLSILKSQLRGNNRNLSVVNDYNISNVSEKVLRIIQSYTDYVNRVVWKKY